MKRLILSLKRVMVCITTGANRFLLQTVESWLLIKNHVPVDSGVFAIPLPGWQAGSSGV